VSQTKRWIVRAILLLSLGGNAYLVLSRIEARMGGGCYGASPDRAYLANATCYSAYNPLNARKGNPWAELSIEKGNAEIIRLVVTPPGVKQGEEIQMYRTEDMIRWSADSKTVTFRLPNANISVTPTKNEFKLIGFHSEEPQSPAARDQLR
jgi:hypothetical protein